jgi:hypothetical protein
MLHSTSVVYSRFMYEFINLFEGLQTSAYCYAYVFTGSKRSALSLMLLLLFATTAINRSWRDQC